MLCEGFPPEGGGADEICPYFSILLISNNIILVHINMETNRKHFDKP